MKICKKCNVEKDLLSFSFRNRAHGILQPYCKQCVAISDKEKYKTEGRKISIRKAMKASGERLKEFIDNYKKENSCRNCGDERFYVLDFHHLKDKEYNISDAYARGISVNKLKEELNKCELLCSNCHRELHYFEKLKELNDEV